MFTLIRKMYQGILRKLVSKHIVEIGFHTIKFKIMVGPCVRKIKMGDQFTLEDLHFLL